LKQYRKQRSGYATPPIPQKSSNEIPKNEEKFQQTSVENKKLDFLNKYV
jgi:hypothetical protein